MKKTALYRQVGDNQSGTHQVNVPKPEKQVASFSSETTCFLTTVRYGNFRIDLSIMAVQKVD